MARRDAHPTGRTSHRSPCRTVIYHHRLPIPVPSSLGGALYLVSKAAMMPALLDTTDWRILRELMSNGRMTNVQLAPAGRHHTSALPASRQSIGGGRPHSWLPCRSRPDSPGLRDDSVRHGNAAQPSRDRPSYLRQYGSWLAAGARKLHDIGRNRLHPKVHRTQHDGFSGFLINHLSATPNVASVKTAVTIRRTKNEPGVPIDERPQHP